jgi:hypothetical protein
MRGCRSCLSLLSRRSQLRVCLTKVIYGQELACRSRLSGPVILAESNTRVYKILGTFYLARSARKLSKQAHMLIYPS